MFRRRWRKRRRWRRRWRRREEGEEKEQHQVTKRPWSLREGSMLSELEIRMLRMVDEEFRILSVEVDMVVEQSKMLSEVEVNNNKDKLQLVFFWLLHFVTTFSYDFWRS